MAESDGDGRRIRSAEAVGRRTLSLTALLLRLNIELAYREDQRHGQTLFGRLGGWAQTEGISAYLSETESEVVASEMGTLDDGRIFELNWRLQALAAILWSVGRLD